MHGLAGWTVHFARKLIFIAAPIQVNNFSDDKGEKRADYLPLHACGQQKPWKNIAIILNVLFSLSPPVFFVIGGISTTDCFPLWNVRYICFLGKTVVWNPAHRDLLLN